MNEITTSRFRRARRQDLARARIAKGPTRLNKYCIFTAGAVDGKYEIFSYYLSPRYPLDTCMSTCVMLSAGFSSVYLYDLGKRLRAMFSHRRVEPGSAKLSFFINFFLFKNGGLP